VRYLPCHWAVVRSYLFCISHCIEWLTGGNISRPSEYDTISIHSLLVSLFPSEAPSQRPKSPHKLKRFDNLERSSRDLVGLPPMAPHSAWIHSGKYIAPITLEFKHTSWKTILWVFARLEQCYKMLSLRWCFLPDMLLRFQTFKLDKGKEEKTPYQVGWKCLWDGWWLLQSCNLWFSDPDSL